MDCIYPAEEEITRKMIKLQTVLKPSLLNKKLVKNKRLSHRSTRKIFFADNIYYDRHESMLYLPNGEKFKGLLTSDLTSLDKGQYFWPNGQIYCGHFDKNNNFHSSEGEVAQLTFPNGDFYLGIFEDGDLEDGIFKSKDGKEIEANFRGGKYNGCINYKDIKKHLTFEGFIVNNKKEGKCSMDVEINNKQYIIKGEYINGLKNGLFTITETSPNAENLQIKGHYKDGQRHGYFDIIDKENNIYINHKYITFLTQKLIKKYNEKYKAKLTGKEHSLSFTYRNNPIKQLTDLAKIQLISLLTLDISRSNINSISFLETEEETLISLQNLILSYNNIKSIEPLSNVPFTKLKKLIANDNQIDNIACISNFKFEELEELDLSSNPIKSLEGVNNWKFPNLFSLTLSRTNISKIDPLYDGDFPNLTLIDLYFSNIHPYKHITPDLFKKCTSLKNIVFEREH
jgi:hypothetical protein